MTVECIGYKSHESGALKGFANFRMTMSNGMAFELFGCGVFMSNGKRWIKEPSRPYEDPETKKTAYISIFRFCEKPHTEAFCKAALQALDTWCAKNVSDSVQEPSPDSNQSFSSPQAAEPQDDLPF